MGNMLTTLLMKFYGYVNPNGHPYLFVPICVPPLERPLTHRYITWGTGNRVQVCGDQPNLQPVHNLNSLLCHLKFNNIYHNYSQSIAFNEPSPISMSINQWEWSAVKSDNETGRGLCDWTTFQPTRVKCLIEKYGSGYLEVLFRNSMDDGENHIRYMYWYVLSPKVKKTWTYIVFGWWNKFSVHVCFIPVNIIFNNCWKETSQGGIDENLINKIVFAWLQQWLKTKFVVC